LCRRHCLAAWTHAPLSFSVGERVKNGDVFFGHSFDLGAREVMAAYKPGNPGRWKQIHATIAGTTPAGYLGCAAAIRASMRVLRRRHK
jgi:hypothetical protein